jgi:ribosomal protein L11 methyltransferase
MACFSVPCCRVERIDHEPPAKLPWIVEASVDTHVALPGGDAVERDDFHAWLWERANGLLGIDEGAVTAADAAARGLVPTDRVIDAAAAPRDRDWVAGLAVADVQWWFADEAAARAAAELVAGLRGCRVRGVRADEPVDHEAASRAAFGTIAVPWFGIVRPAWDEGGAVVGVDGAVTIFIEPGVGFGTGLHETTQLCLAALAERRRRGCRLDRVLDYGSGSGILAIAAAVLGAGRVDAVEIDDHAHPALRANARRNGVAERIHVAKVLGAPGGYDLVVANIVAPVLIEHAAELCARVCSQDGALVLSGLLAADVPEVVDRYAALLGMRPRIQERGEWRCLTFSRE